MNREILNPQILSNGWRDYDIIVRGVRADSWGTCEAVSLLRCLLQTMLSSEKPSVHALPLAVWQLELSELCYNVSANILF